MSFRSLVPLAGLAVLLAGCGEPADGLDPAPADTSADPSAAAILERARAVHGADVLDHATVTFGFRGDRFTASRDGGRFAYTRRWTDSTGAAVRDVLGNDGPNAGLVRIVDGDTVALGEREYLIAEEAVNSVVYFALLPYPLADPAVQPRHVGTDTLADEPYDLVEVTFREEGGGRDHQDRFLYWIHRDRATMDYLAYSYEDSGGGARFRQTVRPRTVGGVRFADHLNFAADPSQPLEQLGRRWMADSLELLSEIVLDEVSVQPGAGP